MMFYYGIVPTIAILTLPLWTALAVATALAAGLWLSALNVRYRDIRYTLPFFTQLWLICTPVAYAVSLVKEPWRPLYALNPMVGVVEGFRWALLGRGEPPGVMVAISSVVVALLLVGGLFYFRRTERTFADIV
jgi:lipopolysaccharide transport system permease protein